MIINYICIFNTHTYIYIYCILIRMALMKPCNLNQSLLILQQQKVTKHFFHPDLSFFFAAELNASVFPAHGLMA